MSPSHTNKRGARYRYYVSQAVLANKPEAAGAIGRVPAAEIEFLIIAALRHHLQANGVAAIPDNERELVERHIERATLTSQTINLQLRHLAEVADQSEMPDPSGNDPAGHFSAAKTMITIAWSSPVPATVKGIIHVPAHNTPIKPSRRDALLIAIAKARKWVDDLASGRVTSFAAIARREGKVERHVRLLAPLAFLSPRIVSALLDGTAPADLTVTTLVRALPDSWAKQERYLAGNPRAVLPST